MPNMSARIEIDGLKELDKRLASLPAAIQAEIEKAQGLNALDMQNVARDMVQSGGRSGRVYKRSKGKIVHQASAPGEPPKSDSGYLASHIRGFVEERFTAVLEAATKYARSLEFGTRKMGARPFMDRSAALVLKRAASRLSAAVRRAAKAMGR